MAELSSSSFGAYSNTLVRDKLISYLYAVYLLNGNGYTHRHAISSSFIHIQITEDEIKCSYISSNIKMRDKFISHLPAVYLLYGSGCQPVDME